MVYLCVSLSLWFILQCHIINSQQHFFFDEQINSMAKRLLLNVLLSVLGDYIEGLSEDNLKLGVWSGEISLNNLQLNRSILQRLNLPVVIAHGSVQYLQVVIPWASLESNPVKIIIDGIYLQVGPLDLAVLDAEELTVRALAMKTFKLQEIDKAIERAGKCND